MSRDRKEDLPAPDGPIIERNWPLWMLPFRWERIGEPFFLLRMLMFFHYRTMSELAFTEDILL